MVCMLSDARLLTSPMCDQLCTCGVGAWLAWSVFSFALASSSCLDFSDAMLMPAATPLVSAPAHSSPGMKSRIVPATVSPFAAFSVFVPWMPPWKMYKNIYHIIDPVKINHHISLQ